jgi:hypothetical protein
MGAGAATLVGLLDLFYDDWIKCAELLELLAHLEGIKRVVRLVASLRRREALVSFLARASLPHRVSEFGLQTEFSTALGDTFQRIVPRRESFGDCVVFVGSAEATENAHAIELGGADALSCAAVYGYPQCCAASYISVQDGTPWVVPFLREAGPAAFFPWQCNKLAGLYPPHLTIIPDYFPCSIHCPATAALALQYERLLLDAGLGELRNRIAAELSRPMLLHRGWIYRFEKLEWSSTSKHGHVGRVSCMPLRPNPAHPPLSIAGLAMCGGGFELVVPDDSGEIEIVAAEGPLLRFSS